MTDTKTIGTVASEMLDNLETKTRVNGDNYICKKETIEWQRDIIRNAHLDRMPNDDIYKRIHNILDCISDVETEDDAQERLYEIEPDIYISDLTTWLADNNTNVYYLNEALEDTETKDGFQLLMIAQSKYITEIGNALIAGIVKHIESEGE